MKISHRGLYALKALLHLAEAHDRGLVKIHEIAEEEDIPEKFLEGILVTLKNARLVTSERGREGGYRLRRPPGEIMIGEVVRIMDGPLAPLGDAMELAQRVRTEPRHPGTLRHVPGRAQCGRRHPRPHDAGRRAPAGPAPGGAARPTQAGARLRRVLNV